MARFIITEWEKLLQKNKKKKYATEQKYNPAFHTTAKFFVFWIMGK